MNKPVITYKFYRSIFRIIPYFRKNKLIWKDKFKTPRVELSPSLNIEWLWWGFYRFVGDDNYWERWLWIHKYNDGDELKAEQTWHWVDYKTNISTWNKK